jgi:PAB1-binding protein PBP1
MAIYTTRLPDRGSVAYRKREAEAERIAREIVGSPSTTIHMREERGQIEPGEDVDEEALYGAVVRPQTPVSDTTTATHSAAESAWTAEFHTDTE